MRRLAATARTPQGRTHARYALAGLGALTPADVLAALGDPEPRAREHAVRLAESFCGRDERVRMRMEELVGDPDPMVRYQLAYSLGAFPPSAQAPALSALALDDFARFREGEPPGEPVSAAARTDFGELSRAEPRPLRFTKSHSRLI